MSRRWIVRVAVVVGLLGGAWPARGVEGETALKALVALRSGYAQNPDALPTRFEMNLTAWQTSPRRLVLSGDRTPGEEDPYVMTHPLFQFRWASGRVLLVDAGLEPGSARAFGRPSEFLGADPIRCGRDAFAAVSPASVRATVFTHLHVDHLQGLRALCRDGVRIPVRLSPEQRTSEERFEAAGRDELAEMTESGCVAEEAWAVEGDGEAPALAGFPGLHRVAVPGHTPGSQMLVGFVRTADDSLRAVVVAGDVVNHRAGFRHDRAKPWWYRKLLVREVDDLQAANRKLLARLDQAGFEIWVNHHVAVPEGLIGSPCP